MRRAALGFGLLLCLGGGAGLLSCGDDEGSAPVCQIEVLSPDGGEVWVADSSYTVLWSHAGSCAEWVAIDLVSDGAACLALADSTANDGEFLWTAETCGPDTTRGRVRVTALSGDGGDESDAELAIVRSSEPCGVLVTRPDGGEAWVEGRRYELTWDPSGDCGNAVRLELLQAGAVCRTIASAAVNDGVYPWNAVRCGGLTGQYALCVTDLATGAADTSDGVFTIAPGCLVLVLSPNGGETWYAGETRTIAWDFSGGCARSVRLELWRGESLCDTLADPADNSGSFEWPVVACGSSGSDYRVRVVDLSTENFDESDEAFTIDTACVLALSSPDGGESLCQGDKVPITWTSLPGCGKDVRLELLHDGVPCATIAAATDNDGAFSWEVAACAGMGGGYAVRLSDPASGAADTSEETFTIQPGCTMAWQQPSGGEIFCAGETVYLVWDGDHPCCGASVRIELLRAGVACDTIAEATANSGEYTWIAAPCDPAGGPYRLRVVDRDSGASATSTGEITLLPSCAIATIAPAPDASLCQGQPVAITWTHSACCGEQVKIDLVRNGEVCQTIAPAAPTLPGSYSWTPAQWQGHASGYQIRITDLESWHIAETPGVFAIEVCRRGE